jgi:hypothetical protein
LLVSRKIPYTRREFVEGMMKGLKMMLEHGADVAARTKVGACACMACRVREDRRLPSTAADRTPTLQVGKTSLHCACDQETDICTYRGEYREVRGVGRRDSPDWAALPASDDPKKTWKYWPNKDAIVLIELLRHAPRALQEEIMKYRETISIEQAEQRSREWNESERKRRERDEQNIFKSAYWS